MGVVVPAHDERDTVEACLASILAAARRVRRAEVRVILVADGCSDGTAERGAAALAPNEGEVLSVRYRSVGAARGHGARHLLRRWSGVPRDRVWLLATDADTTVPEDWIAQHLRWASQGDAALAGVVRVAGFEEHPAGTAARFEATYRLGPDGTHPHVHGANLGVRADAYQAVGGWHDRVTAEDHCLWNRLRAAGYPTRASAASYVITSGRLNGRAPDGFAGALRGLNGPTYPSEHPR